MAIISGKMRPNFPEPTVWNELKFSSLKPTPLSSTTNDWIGFKATGEPSVCMTFC